MFVVKNEQVFMGPDLGKERSQQLLDAAGTVILQEGLAMIALCSCGIYHGAPTWGSESSWDTDIFVSAHHTHFPRHTILVLDRRAVRND